MLKVIAAHAWHDVAESAPTSIENVPAGQGVHVVLKTAPAMGLYVPARQRVQFEAPVLLLNVPLWQGVAFAENCGQNDPIGQTTGAPLPQ